MADPFGGEAPGMSDPGDDIYVVTPDDSNDLPTACRALRANDAGTIKVTMRSGNTPTLNFAAGETRVGRFVRVWATDTTVTVIEGLV